MSGFPLRKRDELRGWSLFDEPETIDWALAALRHCWKQLKQQLVPEETQRKPPTVSVNWIGGHSDTAQSLSDEFAAKGEFVVLVAPPGTAAVSDAEIEAHLKETLTQQSVRDAARTVAETLGVGRNRVYKLALALAEEGT